MTSLLMTVSGTTFTKSLLTETTLVELFLEVNCFLMLDFGCS